MRTDLRTGLPCTNPIATHKAIKAGDRTIRTAINARALGMTTRMIDNVLLALALAPRTPSRPVRRRRAAV